MVKPKRVMNKKRVKAFMVTQYDACTTVWSYVSHEEADKVAKELLIKKAALWAMLKD